MVAVNGCIGRGFETVENRYDFQTENHEKPTMPLRREGTSAWRALLYGQLVGAGAVLYVQPILPYALSIAAGAMIFVIVDDLIPETTQCGNQKLATMVLLLFFS
ncbi:hypothetical protein PsorP6_004837 [Peronosclerospora sorghi]|uniref:Uncharacterized protein n=1 Tax=Peronosclerospora sorghi TaxID=230839 RepID=A0ACC0VN01_9STRA|nr:hypothetical protein PsorP6_004837 [Peronosclerospora sorghi]